MQQARNFKKHFPVLFLAVCILILPLYGCSGQQKKVSKSGFYFDTIITITLYGTTDESKLDQCFALAAEFERKFSNTIADSEISDINAHAGHFVTVSNDTRELIAAGISYGALSGGEFDITIGKLSALWNIPEIAKTSTGDNNEAVPFVLPDPADIREVLSHVNDQKIIVDKDQVMLSDSKAAIDLGGIAKGYIADRMRDYLRGEGITSGIINLGGNVLTLGEKNDQSPYSIGIQKPFAESGTSLGILKVADASVVSSGVYERYFTVDGRRYHHILDTSTGYPVDNDLWQVTIISEDSMTGDALSTICFALGLADGMALVESLDNTEAIFVTDDGALHFSSGIGETVFFESF